MRYFPKLPAKILKNGVIGKKYLLFLPSERILTENTGLEGR